MKKLFTSFLTLLFLNQAQVKAQNIFNGEPVQVVGAFNSYTTTPYNSDYRTAVYRKISTTAANPTDGCG